MPLKRLVPYVLLPLLAFLMIACRPGPPKGVLSAGDMQDVLYDMHLAEALAQQKPVDSVAFYTRLYRDAVLSKYDLTEADFDRSLEWYMRHTSEMGKIYKQLAERLGTSESDMASTTGGQATGPSLSGDTLSIWRGASSALLSSQASNHFSFEQRADTALHAGDMVEWRFNASWFYSDGDRTAIAYLIVRYEGDSIATTQQFVSSQGSNVITIRLANRKVQLLEGFVYQRSPWSVRPRLLSLTAMQLLRIRPHAPLPQEVQQQLPSGAGTVPVTDSVKRPERIRQRDSAATIQPGHKITPVR